MRAELRQIFGDRVSFELTERTLYSRDLAVMPDALGLGLVDLMIDRIPEAVVKPRTVEEVVQVAELSHRELIPLTPRGAATGGVGGAVPTKKGIVVDLLNMDNIVDVDRENLTATVEAGIIWENLEDVLNAQGLACRALPSSAPSSTVGGWIASSGVGHGSFEYGAIDKNVAAVELVVPNGEIWNLEGDQLKMVMGAYGITGFITKATLFIRELDETVPVEIEFDSTANLESALLEIIDTIPIWTLNVEMDDFVALKNAVKGRRGQTKHALLIGTPKSRYDVEAFRQVAEKHNGHLHAPADEAWEGRYLPLRIKKVAPSVVTGEVYVPTNRMFDYLEIIYKKLEGETFGVEATLANRDEAAVRIYTLVDERDVGGMNYLSSWSIPMMMLKVARKFGGRTYQTGLFLGKEAQHYFGRERLKRIFAFKRSVDPNAMMNPGKTYLHYRYAMMFGFATPFLSMLGGRSTQKTVPPEEVHARLTDYMEHIYTCASCAYCRDGCPIFTERGWESSAPKGKMVFAKEYMESRIDVDEYMYKNETFECTLCGQCQEVCQAEIPLCDIWADIRAKFWELGYQPMDAHVMMQDSLVSEGNPFKEPSSGRDELFPEDAVGLIREGDTRSPDILVWAGCVNSYQDIKTLPAFMKVLDAAGVTYTALGTEEGCCGYVAHITGMPAFDDLAHGAAERINECGAPILVTPCAGCDKSFAKIYPEHGIEVKPEALHGVQYLDRLIQEGRLKPEKPFKKRVTWHDPCDIGRHLGIYDEPRRVLRSIPDLDFVEMPSNREKAKCCGGGGGLKASDLDLSSDIALSRVKEALAVGAEVIVSSCPSCKSNLKIAADRAKKEKLGKVQVMDINELLIRTLPKKKKEE